MLIRFLRWCEIPQPYFPGNVVDMDERRVRALMEELPEGCFEIVESTVKTKAKPELEAERPAVKTRMASHVIKG